MLLPLSQHGTQTDYACAGNAMHYCRQAQPYTSCSSAAQILVVLCPDHLSQQQQLQLGPMYATRLECSTSLAAWAVDSICYCHCSMLQQGLWQPWWCLDKRHQQSIASHHCAVDRWYTKRVYYPTSRRLHANLSKHSACTTEGVCDSAAAFPDIHSHS